MREEMRCELISWADVEQRCQHLAGQIRASGFFPDLIIAIGRGGYVPARLLCDKPAAFWPPRLKGSGFEAGLYLCSFGMKGLVREESIDEVETHDIHIRELTPKIPRRRVAGAE